MAAVQQHWVDFEEIIVYTLTGKTKKEIAEYTDEFLGMKLGFSIESAARNAYV
jgi:hypothetical protein